jgi:hypothetical protein
MSGAPKSQPVKPPKVSRADEREARLKLALKANMARRKAQARARAETEANDDTRNGPDNDNE